MNKELEAFVRSVYPDQALPTYVIIMDRGWKWVFYCYNSSGRHYTIDWELYYADRFKALFPALIKHRRIIVVPITTKNVQV